MLRKNRLIFIVAGLFVVSVLVRSKIQAPLSSHVSLSLKLKQRVLSLQANAVRNLMKEEEFSKRNSILSKSLLDIEKLRLQHPVQVSKDERLIEKLVLNLRLLKIQKLTQYKGIE